MTTAAVTVRGTSALCPGPGSTTSSVVRLSGPDGAFDSGASTDAAAPVDGVDRTETPAADPTGTATGHRPWAGAGTSRRAAALADDHAERGDTGAPRPGASGPAPAPAVPTGEPPHDPAPVREAPAAEADGPAVDVDRPNRSAALAVALLGTGALAGAAAWGVTARHRRRVDAP